MRAKIYEDRDFDYRMQTGESLYDKFEDPDAVFYNPLKSVGERYQAIDYQEMNEADERSDEDEDVKPVKSGSKIGLKVTQIIKRVEDDQINAQIESLSEYIRNNENVPNQYKQNLARLKRGIQSPEHFSMNQYLSFISNYINGKEKYTKSDTQIFIKYLVFEFIKNGDNDFPFLNINDEKVNKLIDKTSTMDDGHPMKWTQKRKQLLESLYLPEHKFIIFDSYLNLWRMYIIPKNVKIQKLTPADVRFKYLLDYLLTKFSYKYVSEFIIFQKIDNGILKRFVEVIHYMRDLLDDHFENFRLSSIGDFLLEEQLTRQYVFKEYQNENMLQGAISKKYDIRIPTVNQALEYFEEKDMLLEIEIF